jgi:hypothetical protein
LGQWRAALEKRAVDLLGCIACCYARWLTDLKYDSKDEIMVHFEFNNISTIPASIATLAAPLINLVGKPPSLGPPSVDAHPDHSLEAAPHKGHLQ